MKTATITVMPSELGKPSGFWKAKLSVRHMETVDGKAKMKVVYHDVEGRDRKEAWDCGLAWLGEQETK